MDKTRKYCALDLGGSHGRAIVGSFNGETLKINVVDSFNYMPVKRKGTLHWDVRQIYTMIKGGIGEASKQVGRDIDSLGIDTMGINFALLDRKSNLLELPPYTRIRQNKEVHKYIFYKYAPEKLYQTTGLQLSKLNTLYHLVKISKERPELLEKANTFLMLSDLLNYWLTGEKACEATIASTSYLMDAKKRDWAYELIDCFGISRRLFPKIVKTGTCIGSLNKELRNELGQPNLKVIASASHDTASAIVCTSPQSEGYISLGTWGMLGCVRPEPILTKKAMELGFANEGAAYGDVRFIFNSLGMFLLKKCIDIWNITSLRKITFDELNHEVKSVKPFRSLINPRDERFLVPDNMIHEIRRYCEETNQPVPITKGEITRCIMESLALNFKDMLVKMIKVTNEAYPQMHVLGGASQNSIFMQFISDALNRPLRAGPEEAAAIGNILIQMYQRKDIASLEQGRKIVEESFPYVWYEPKDPNPWDETYRRFIKIIGNNDFDY